MKSLFLFLVALLPAASSFAQQNKFDIGVEGGPGLTFLHGNSAVDAVNNTSPAFSGGLTFRYKLRRILSVQTGISLERKGQRINYVSVSNTGEVVPDLTISNKFDYLSAPVLLRATFGNKLKFFVQTGPYFSALLRQNVSFINGDKITTYSQVENYKKFDTGLAAGIGITFPVKEKLLLAFELRNNFGLYNISTRPVYGGGTIQTNSTNLLLGVAYKLGKREDKAK